MSQPNDRPLFSLLLTTINRVEEVGIFLDGMVGQTCGDFEIIFADQNRDGRLDGLLESFAGRLPLTVIDVAPGNVSEIRNDLLEKASGELILFPDDDCVYAPFALARLEQIFALNPQLNGVFLKWRAAWPKERRPRACAPKKVKSSYPLFGCSVSFSQCYRAEIFDEIRFDPAFGPAPGRKWGSGEDTDLALQAWATGRPLAMLGECLVKHPTGPARSDREKALIYGIGRMQLLNKYDFPVWFRLVNVLWPLRKIFFRPAEAWAAFRGRLRGLFL